MSATSPAVVLAPVNARRDSIRALARLEARRALRGSAFWIGLAVSVWMAYMSRGLDWQGAAYGEFVLGSGPLAAGIFVAGVIAGSRDRGRDECSVLAEEAALDDPDRAIARLLGLVPLVAIGSVLVVAVAIGIRIEGGLWVGEEPGRTDSAVHGVAEVLLPILLLVLGACAGVAAGRTFRRRVPVIVVGLIVWFLLIGAFWVWQWVPAVYVVPTQIQPIEVAIAGDATDASALPGDWLLAYGEDDGEWRRILVHEPLTAWHDVYLVGLATLAVGIAVRSRTGRRLMVVGAVVAGLGIAGQAVVMPDGAAPVEIPE